MSRRYCLDRAVDAFWAKVDKVSSTNGCWLWTGGKDGAGYGMFWFEGRTHRAHRLAWAWSTDCPMPPRYLPVDHTCHTKNCVNHAHLRLVTTKQNIENKAGLQKNNTSGYQGVLWLRDKRKWVVRVTHNGTTHYGGYYNDPVLANVAAVALRLKLHTHNDLDRK